ncbi:MAG: hypothetical protein ACI8QC_001756 [Planctomycetota bacterium]|jgi:hypothetical protein
MTAPKTALTGFVLRLATLVALVAPTQASALDGPFHELTVPDAFLRAESQGKIVCLYFHNATLPESKRMLRTTLADEAVVNWLNENTIAVLVDSEEDKATVSRFSIKRFPVVHLRAADKTLLDVMEFFHTPDAFLASGKATLAGRSINSIPFGTNAEDPYAWLAWGNYLFNKGGDVDDMVHAYWWCMTNAEQYSPGFRARYFEFIVKRLAHTKRISAVSLQRLYSERDRLRGLLFGGNGTNQAAHEMARINFWLRKEEDTRKTFLDLIQGNNLDPSMARCLLFHELAGLVAHRNYKEVLEHLGDPLKVMTRRHTRMVQAQERAVKTETAVDLGFVVTGVRETRAQWVEDSANAYEVLLHEGLGKDAKDLSELVLTYVPTGRAYAIFIGRAVRLELNDVAKELAERGLKVVKPNGVKRIRTALARIQEPEPVATDGDSDGDLDGKDDK